MNGETEIWYHSLVLSKGVVGWSDFKKELCNRFSVELLRDIAKEFNKLSQTGTVDELLEEFEELKAQMLMRNLNLNESHLFV